MERWLTDLDITRRRENMYPFELAEYTVGKKCEEEPSFFGGQTIPSVRRNKIYLELDLSIGTGLINMT